MKTVILDFVGVVADLDLIQIVKDLSLKEKFSALRIYLAIKKHKKVRILFDEYQRGLFDAKTLQNLVAKLYPSSAKVIPLLLEGLSKNLFVNEHVLDYVKAIKKTGVQVLLMSNSTPETEQVMEKHNLNKIFDGIILSTDIKLIKPEKEIYKYAISTYNLTPQNTIMIDDSKKNLLAAKTLGIQPFQCKNTNETCKILETYLAYHTTSTYYENFSYQQL